MSNWKFAGVCAFIVLLGFYIQSQRTISKHHEALIVYGAAIETLVENQKVLIEETKSTLANHQKAIEDIAAFVPNLKVYKGKEIRPKPAKEIQEGYNEHIN